jgi:hypothetical protein
MKKCLTLQNYYIFIHILNFHLKSFTSNAFHFIDFRFQFNDSDFYFNEELYFFQKYF